MQQKNCSFKNHFESNIIEEAKPKSIENKMSQYHTNKKENDNEQIINLNSKYNIIN